MKLKSSARKGAAGDQSKQQCDQRTPYSRDVIVAGDSQNSDAFLNARFAEGLLRSTSDYVAPAFSAYDMAGARDAPSGTVDLAVGPTNGSSPSVGAPVQPVPTEPATSPSGDDSDTTSLTSTAVTSSEGAPDAGGFKADPPLVTASTVQTEAELQDAVGGGVGVPTTLEMAYEAPGTPSADGVQASSLAVNDSERQVGVQREKLVGSPRADRIVGGPGKNEIDGREGNDELVGGASDDVFVGGAGDDVLDGGLGNDIARYRGSVLEYDLTRISSTQTRVRHARPRPGQDDGNDLARNVKRLDFKDRQVFLDGSNNAPLAQPDEGLSTVDGRSLTIPFARLLGNDVDFDGDRLTITQVKGKPSSSFKIVGNSVVFTPPAGIQWALADFSSYENTFLYTISDGKGGTSTASASVTITRPANLRGLPTGPAGVSRDGAGGPGESPGAIFTKVSGQSVTGTGSDDLILVPSSGAMTGGTVDGGVGTDELRFTNTGTAQTLTLGSTLTNVEQVVVGTGSGPIADTTGTIANGVSASGVGYGLLITGNAGANTLTGTAFGDQIDGGLGADRMTGGAGNDTFFVDNASDVVVESSSTGGTDTVYASVSYTLPARVENLTLTGIGNINGTGNSLANTLTGNTGNNTLNGGTGTDIMVGGLGDDTYVVNVTTDVVTELADQGTDTVNSSVTYTLGANVENLVLTGTSNRNGTGNALNNSLTGNSAVNTLNGGDGDDILEGAAGNDILDGGAGSADIARYQGPQGNYTVTPGTGGSFIVASTADGTDTVRNIEFLRFSDVTVPLGGSNQPPIAVADTGTTSEDTPWVIPATTLTANDSDPDAGDTLSITAVGGANNGSVLLNAGNVTFTPATHFNGTGGYTYTLSDGKGGTATGNVSVTVSAVNDAPVASNDGGFSTPLNTPVIIAASNLLTNDTDVEGDTLTVTNVNTTSSTVDFDGTNIIFTPSTGFTGTATFTYQASDGQATSAPATVSVTVGGSSGANEIVLENQKPGNPKSEWDVTTYDTRIEGYAAQFSVNKGEDVQFKVESDAAYQIDIYRLGYYGGDGARKVATIGSLPISSQPNPVTDAATGLVDAGNWNVSATWDMPADAVSGVYIAKLVRNGGGANHIPFVVRDDTGSSDVLFQTADTTWQAYNDWGGNSLYSGSPAGRAYKVSYNRPINTRFGSAPGQPEDFLFDSEYPTIRFLEANGYDVSYFSGIDSDRRGAEIQEHDIFLSVGHDEYWSGQQRANVEAARNAGVDLAFLQRQRGLLEDALGKQHRRLQHALRHAGLVQGNPPHRHRRSQRAGHRDVAGPAVRNRRGPSGKCADRADLHGQRRQRPAHENHGAGRRRPAAILAQHRPRLEQHAARLGHPVLRMGRGSRQRLAACRVDPAVFDDRSEHELPAGLRLDLRHGTGDAQSDDVPGAERRARVRGRHHTVGLGSRFGARRFVAHRQPDSAGDGESVRRHGRPALYAHLGADAGHRVDRHDPTDLDHHLAHRREHPAAGDCGNDHRHRIRCRRTRGRRGGVHRWRHDVATRRGEIELDL